MDTVVKISGLVKSYKELTAVNDLSLEIKEGEVFGLLGPNGSGKSTTINCMLSLLDFNKGEIELFGKPMSPTAYDIKKNIGVIMQNVAVFDELTVYENIDYFCGLYVTDKAERKKCVEDAIKFSGLEDFTKFRPKKLSGGLLRRLNIACGIAHKPKLIILDEPTRGVDVGAKAEIYSIMQHLAKQGVAIIMISSDLPEILGISDRIIVMKEGHISGEITDHSKFTEEEVMQLAF